MEYLTLDDDCTNEMLCDISETCTQFKGLETSGTAMVDSISTEYTKMESDIWKMLNVKGTCLSHLDQKKNILEHFSNI